MTQDQIARLREKYKPGGIIEIHTAQPLLDDGINKILDDTMTALAIIDQLQGELGTLVGSMERINAINQELGRRLAHKDKLLAMAREALEVYSVDDRPGDGDVAREALAALQDGAKAG